MKDEYTERTRMLRKDAEERRTAVRLANIENKRVFDRRLKRLRSCKEIKGENK